MLTNVQVNVWNIEKISREEPRRYEAIRLDSNNDCNVHCVYCHNRRTKELITTDALVNFLNNNVISVNEFQVGCVMEPTLDPRMCDVLLMIAGSRARPKQSFQLQTNGILLHQHDYGKMRDAGLTRLSVSIDAADPATNKTLRGGTSLKKVHSNLLAFREACPSVEVTFMTTVTSINIHGMEDLVRFGLTVGAQRFVFRQIFYYENSNIVDHTRMPGLLVTADAFSHMKDLITDMFCNQAKLHFLDAPTIVRVAKKRWKIPVSEIIYAKRRELGTRHSDASVLVSPVTPATFFRVRSRKQLPFSNTMTPYQAMTRAIPTESGQAAQETVLS